MIEITGLHFSHPRGATVFEGLDFGLKKGERVGLVGPTGAGKTTLLHLIMGLLRPQAGEIKILGWRRVREEDFLEVRRNIGFLFQDSDDQLFCPTVEEDIAFGPLNLGMSHEEARRAVREATEALGIRDLEKKVTHRLSGGEKRLVALATIIAMRPSCYLLDEPTAGIDEDKTRGLIDYLTRQADTCIITSHDQNFLAASTGRVFQL